MVGYSVPPSVIAVVVVPIKCIAPDRADVLSSTYFLVAAAVSALELVIAGNVTVPVNVGFAFGALLFKSVVKLVT